jgi:hypothetical protein
MLSLRRKSKITGIKVGGKNNFKKFPNKICYEIHRRDLDPDPQLEKC